MGAVRLATAAGFVLLQGCTLLQPEPEPVAPLPEIVELPEPVVAAPEPVPTVCRIRSVKR